LNSRKHDSQGIDKETRKTHLAGNEVSIGMALENPAFSFLRYKLRPVNIFPLSGA
jgi:hypothetical protein